MLLEKIFFVLQTRKTIHSIILNMNVKLIRLIKLDFTRKKWLTFSNIQTLR